MQHAVILAHPSPASFNASAAKAWAEAAGELGHEVHVRDLYAIGFEPRLAASELPWAPHFAPGEDVREERKIIARSDVLVLVYPLWFNAPPAILKGYVERVLGFGFAYGPAGTGTQPLLTGKMLVSITTSGAPNAWAARTKALEHLRAGFDDHLAAVCGLTVLEHQHFGNVRPGIRPDAVEGMLTDVRRLARRLFGGSRKGAEPRTTVG
jgi:NAD(P)H dehydrogenase (quinone)